ncbi:MAG: dockerin type I repeat-containing protein, partial [Clostridia bacterium]|nr:dockerin type I repeat-containing protein [Clostridia bacterium]
GDWIIDSNATCTVKGSKHKECTACGAVIETDSIPAVGHTASDWIIDTDATCVDEGSKHKECTVCNLVLETEIIPSTGHSFTNYVSDENATCTDGTKTAVCDHGCGTKDTVIDIGSGQGHTLSDWIINTNATCVDEGSKHKECTVCNLVLETEIIPSTGHSFTNYVSDGNATLEADGTKTALCDHGCGAKDTVTDEGSKLEFNDITSDIYEVKDGFISGISIKTTVKELKESVNETGYVRVVKDGKVVEDNTALATGMKLQLVIGNKVVKEVTVVVTGDTNGDGNISVTDMISVKAHILKKSTLTDAYAKAGDTNGDGGISITDFIQIKAHILGKSSLE